MAKYANISTTIEAQTEAAVLVRPVDFPEEYDPIWIPKKFIEDTEPLEDYEGDPIEIGVQTWFLRKEDIPYE